MTITSITRYDHTQDTDIRGKLLFRCLCKNCKERPLASSCLSVRPFVSVSVRLEQLGSHRTDFHEILYFRIFFPPKSVEKIQVSLTLILLTWRIG